MSSTIRHGNLLLKLPEGIEVFKLFEENEVITLYDKEDNQIIPEYVEVGLGYEKKNGQFKVTSSIPSKSSVVSTNLYELLSRYDLLYAIDTNNKNIDGTEYCISCRMAIYLEHEGSKQWSMKLVRLPTFIFTNPTKHGELIGWSQFIEQESLDHKKKAVGIITDHGLGDMPLYNRQEKSIIDDKYLPSNIELLYASAERDITSPLNKAIQQCDADSNSLLKKLADGSMDIKSLTDTHSTNYEKSGFLIPKC